MTSYSPANRLPEFFTSLGRSGKEGASLSRKKSLVHPNRHHDKPHLIRSIDESESRRCPDPWTLISKIATFWAPSFILSKLGLRDPPVQQAWREKVTLCIIIAILGGFIAFFTLFMTPLLCPASQQLNSVSIKTFGTVLARGILRNVSAASEPYLTDFANLPPGFDVTTEFNQPDLPQCSGSNFMATTLKWPCEKTNGCFNVADLDTNKLPALTKLNNIVVSPEPIFSWDMIKEDRNLFVIDRTVLNMAPYFQAFPNPIQNDFLDTSIRKAVNLSDGTFLFFNDFTLRNTISCLSAKYGSGHPQVLSPNCTIARILLILSLIAILGVLLSRFFMAIFFDYFVSARLSKNPNPDKVIEPFMANKSSISALKSSEFEMMYLDPPTVSSFPASVAATSQTKSVHGPNSNALITSTGSDIDLYTVLLITCYSEGEMSIRTTVESLAETSYNDSKKLLFIIADGIITGKGNDKSTPDICKDMIELDYSFGEDAKPYSYVAVAQGAKAHNMGKVYCGHFRKFKGIDTLEMKKLF